MPYLVVYDKDTHRTVSGLVGITFGGNETDRNGLFATVMNGPVDVAGNRINRCARPNQVIPRHASGIVRPTGGNRLCQSGDRHVGFDALS